MLTAGAVQSIIDNGKFIPATLKVSKYKLISNGLRYRLTLTDGTTQSPNFLLPSSKNYLIESKQLQEGAIIRLIEIQLNNTTEAAKRIGVMKEFEILSSGGHEPSDSTSNVLQPNSSNSVNGIPPSAYAAHQKTPPKAQFPVFSGGSAPSTPGSGGSRIFPISSLNPYQNRWAICARCSQKSTMRTWSNARGEGKLFNFNLTDESGEIRVTAFKAEADKFFEVVQLDKCYTVSRGVLKPANRQFNNTNNDYELALTSESVIEPCDENDTSCRSLKNIPRVHFDFVPISSLDNKQVNDFVDVVGVVQDCSEVQELISRATQKQLKKRDMFLVDQSCCMVKLTLWGEEAEKMQIPPGDNSAVLIVKGARVVDYAGRSLSTTSNSMLLLNPTDVPQAVKLRGWYAVEGSRTSFVTFQAVDGKGGMSGGNAPASWKLLSDLKGSGIGVGDRPDYFTVVCDSLIVERILDPVRGGCQSYFKDLARVTTIRPDNVVYRACAIDGCNKKVVSSANGFFRCEKCSQETTSFKWRLLLQMSIADFTSNQWCSCFQDQAEVILTTTAQEVGTLNELNDKAPFDAIISAANHKEFVFRLRAKMEVYNDENRLKVIVVDAKPMDYRDYNKTLLQRLKLLAAELAA